MAWILLVAAGLLEVLWASLLPSTHGLTRPWPTAAFLAALTASMVLLAQATREIPVGTAYGVWVGIGAIGAAAVGILVNHEPANAGRVGFLVLLAVSIVGLKATSAH